MADVDCINITIVTGVCTIIRNFNDNPNTLLKTADTMLYKAKDSVQ